MRIRFEPAEHTPPHGLRASFRRSGSANEHGIDERRVGAASRWARDSALPVDVPRYAVRTGWTNTERGGTLPPVNPDLHAFVREALARGTSRDDVRKALREARWPEDEIEAELAAWHDAGLGLPVPRRRLGFSPREAFLYMLLFVALYLVAFNVGSILFAWIERLWPDAAMASSEEYWDRRQDWVRFALSCVLVAFPVYLYTSRITGRAVAADPEKRNSGVRRWLTYLTLFNAACVLIGDFIVTLQGFFKGELTARFLAKAGVVAAIGVWLFTHYMGGLRRDEGPAPRAAGPSWLARTAAGMVVATALLGLWMAGSPAVARKQALDQRRVRELYDISNAVQAEHGSYGTFPANLQDLVRLRTLSGLQLFDPVTRMPYRYQVLDSVRFRLCARFDAPDSVGPYSAAVDPFWRHTAGNVCFTFEAPRRARALPAPGR